MWLFDPKQGDPIFAFWILAGVSALEPHQQDGDDQNAEDGEGIKEHKVEEGIVGADDRLQRGAWKTSQEAKKCSQMHVQLATYISPAATNQALKAHIHEEVE